MNKFVTATANDADEDFSHCTVCVFAYDDDERKPKFLSCHHTFCLHCVKSFNRKQRDSIPCPKCRKETLCPVGQETGLMTNTYALKFLTSVSLTPTAKSLTVENHWCFKCKNKATVSCIIGHGPSIVIMESQPTKFFTDIHKSIDNEEAHIEIKIEEKKVAKQVVKRAHDTLNWGLAGMKLLDQKIDVDIEKLSFYKNSIRTIPENSTATSLSQKINAVTHSRIFQENSEFLPSRKLVKVLENLLRACGIGEEELNSEQMDQLKRLEAVISGSMTNDARPGPRSGVVVVNFGVTMTFCCQSEGIDRNGGTVIIQPDPDTFVRLFRNAFISCGPPCETAIVAADVGTFVLFGGIEPIIEKIFLNSEFPTSFPSLLNSGDLFSASEMEVKLIDFSHHGSNERTVNGFTLAFFLDRWPLENKGIFNGSIRSFPFGRIIKGGKVIETMSMLSPDARKNVKVFVGSINLTTQSA